jgi:hypothetical protein
VISTASGSESQKLISPSPSGPPVVRMAIEYAPTAMKPACPKLMIPV